MTRLFTNIKMQEITESLKPAHGVNLENVNLLNNVHVYRMEMMHKTGNFSMTLAAYCKGSVAYLGLVCNTPGTCL